MPKAEPGAQKSIQHRRPRSDTTLVFDLAQKVPCCVLDAVIEEWLVPCVVEQFLCERGVTRCALAARYRPFGQEPESTMPR